MKNKIATGIFEVDLFSEEVDSPYHPDAVRLRAVLEGVAKEYHCELLTFGVDKGTVTFSFDSEELTAAVLRLLNESP